jgi:hypothetical protein
MTEASLYERLGGAFAIAAVVDHFSEAVVHNPIVGQASDFPFSGSGTPQSGQTSRPQIHAHPRNRAVLLLARKKPTAN